MKRPHPLYHFRPEFTPRPKLVVRRGFNWPLVVFIVAYAVFLGAAVFLAWHLFEVWRVWEAAH